MLKRIGRLASFISNTRLLKQFYSMSSKGYLAERGWIHSSALRRPVDREGNPMPWTTLSFIDFIEPRLNHNLAVFEYGSGNSTLFYSARVARVVSVESDRGWFTYVDSKSLRMSR